MAIMQEAIAQSSASLTAVPTEIITSIFANLYKSELKSVRLVCHFFDEASLPLLFDKAIISDQDTNFAPFRNITSTRLRLYKHVKTLVYDLQWFDNLNEAYYILDLVRQLKQDLAVRLAQVDSSLIPEQLKKTLAACEYFKDPGTTHDREKILLPWMKFVRKGYQEYRNRWLGQNSNASAQNFPCLAKALLHCPRMQHIEVRASWDFHYQCLGNNLESLLPRYSSSGFLARHWHPLYLRPKIPSQDPHHRRRLLADVFSAIQQSDKKLAQFSFGNGCALGPSMHQGGQSMYNHIIFAFQHLTSLSFDVDTNLPPAASYHQDSLFRALSITPGRLLGGLASVNLKRANGDCAN
ncbi:MAG: hypothetical protein Q9170_008212 [Blastenia crenularia]